MSLEYDEYLNEHVVNVQKALNWMQKNLKDCIDESAMRQAQDNVMHHDESKLNLDEYRAYDAYFYGGNRTTKVCADFNRAWLLHQHRNPHHWQYWVLINDNKGNDKNGIPHDTFMSQILPMPMPLEYVYEMIADWWSFSWNKGNLFEIFSWYNEHGNNPFMHFDTRCIVADILKEMWNILSAQEAENGKDMDEIEKRYMLYWMRKIPELEVESIPYDPTVVGVDEYAAHSDDQEDHYKYGVPQEKKFPMPDAKHVKSAIKFFNYVEPKYEKQLARAILARMEEYGISFEDFGVGDDNRFKRYIPKHYISHGDLSILDDPEGDSLGHHGRKDQKWGVRNGPPYPLDQETIRSSYGSNAKIMETNPKKSDGEKNEGSSEKPKEKIEKPKPKKNPKLSDVAVQLEKEYEEVKLEYDIRSKMEKTDPEYLKLLKMEMDELDEEVGSRYRMAKFNDPDDDLPDISPERLKEHPIEDLDELKKLNYNRFNKNSVLAKARYNINHPDDDDAGRHYNCPNCAAAFEMTERGYDVIARPKVNGSNVENIEDFFKGGKLTNSSGNVKLLKPDDSKDFGGDEKYWGALNSARRATKEKTVNELKAQGEGARGILVFGWLADYDPDLYTTSYHATNYKVQKGKNGLYVMFYDAQSRKSYKYNGSVNCDYFMDADPREVYFMRTDNLEVSDLITTAVYSNKKG